MDGCVWFAAGRGWYSFIIWSHRFIIPPMSPMAPIMPPMLVAAPTATTPPTRRSAVTPPIAIPRPRLLVTGSHQPPYEVKQAKQVP